MYYEEYSPYAMFNIPIDRVPEDIQMRMIKVFGKHSVQEIREWSRKLMQSYQLLHAVEKPMNLDYAKPFANTTDLKNMAPKIFSELARKKYELEQEEMKDKSVKTGFTVDLDLEEDPRDKVTKLMLSAREAEGKRASRSDEKDALEK